jgi:hypothetical protein
VFHHASPNRHRSRCPAFAAHWLRHGRYLLAQRDFFRRDHGIDLPDLQGPQAGRRGAGSFVASEGAIRGPFLEAAMRQVRAENPGMQASDMELANAILARNAVAE